MKEPFNNKISNKNLRATALVEFWDDQYKESIYLWPGAKHSLLLEEFENPIFETCKNIFSTPEELSKGYNDCVNLYYRFLPLLSRTFNDIHKLKLSTRFWQITFGFWLFRHICNSYEKFEYLKLLNTNSTSLILLDENSFYIPQNHYDYFNCFSNDFGVQQMVSQYFNLKGIKRQMINKEYISINNQNANSSMILFKHSIWIIKKLIKRYILKNTKKIDSKIALLGVFFSKDVVDDLVLQSAGLINNLSLPSVLLKRNPKDLSNRRQILKIQAQNHFEEYLINTLVYCTPKDYIENFKKYFLSFNKDIERRTFSHIVSEDWISNIPNAIYIALAKEKNRNFISYEHGNGTFFYRNDMDFICFDIADKYLTVGWDKGFINLVQGGFASRSIEPYKPDNNKKDILFVSRTVPFYDLELIDRNIVNPNFIKELQIIDDFIKALPERLKEHFAFRPRKSGDNCWNTEFQLNLHLRKIRIESGDFSQCIQQPRIIVIDHISTALAEILLIGIPFVLLYNIRSVSLYDKVTVLFDELIACDVVHLDAQSAINHISTIYENVQEWWHSARVQKAINNLKGLSLSPASKTTDYLLSIVEQHLI